MFEALEKPAKVVGFVGSPHKDGNTSWSVKKIIEGAQEGGADTETWFASELDIKPCRGCNGCKKADNGCVIKDDMRKVYKSLETADAIVVASPIYMGQMSAQTKLFMDRLYAVFSPRFSPYYKEKASKKKLVLVFTQGNPDPGKFKSYGDYTKELFEMLEFDVVDLVIIPGTRSESAENRAGLESDLRHLASSLIP